MNYQKKQNMGKEIWKPIVGYEGIYEISNFGHIRSRDRVVTYKDGRKYFYKGKHLKPINNGSGYFYVNLVLNKHYTPQYIHRLVAVHFVDNPFGDSQVNHKDENTANNNACNLEWCTPKYNANYGSRNERVAQKNGRKVWQYDKRGYFVKEWGSAASAAKSLGLTPSAISNCARGILKSSGGYMWQYATKDVEHPQKLEALPRFRSTPIPVVQYTLNGSFIAFYASIQEAGKLLKIDDRGIGRAVSGEYKTYGGYKWEAVI